MQHNKSMLIKATQIIFKDLLIITYTGSNYKENNSND